MKVNFVVVDSGPIIKGAILENFSKHAITVPGVIKEIKDLKTRERIRNLPPYFFSVRSPSEEAIKHVMSVGKKTGDVNVLSKVDIEVLALAYEMQFLKSPEMIEKMFEKIDIDSDIESEINETEENFFEEANSLSDITDSEDDGDDQSLDEKLNDLQIDVNEELEAVTDTKGSLNDDEGWITTENFQQMQSTNFGLASDTDQISLENLPEVPLIGCLTTDFPMQNVLLQMGITILSVSGMVIKEPRIFVSWCRSCFKKFNRTDIHFCPHCGNENLGRVPAKIKENGEIELYLKKNFQPNLKHTIFSIPTPKGGKHRDGTSYIYCADQKLPMERVKKSKFKFDVNEDGNVPFIMNEVTSKSSVLGINGRRNQQMRPSRPKGNRHRR